MKTLLCFGTLLVVVLCDVPMGDKLCTIAKAVGKASHTACLPKKNELPDEMKKSLVDVHNNLRKKVEPTASNMQAMVWDEAIADLAQRWAENCELKHDTGNRDILGYYDVGQNAGTGSPTAEDNVVRWFDERKDYTFSRYRKRRSGEPKVGHYTQVVWASTNRVGCGVAYCDNYKGNMTVCNYAPAGNFIGQYPYKKGKVAEDCPSKKTADNLCDCGGKICLYDGELNLGDCSCKCQGAPGAQIASENCKLNCPNVEDTNPYFKYFCKYNKQHCNNGFTTFDHTFCPKTCGTCQKFKDLGVI